MEGVNDEARLLADFRSKFQVEELLIAQTQAWSWSVRPAQPTLGAGILSLNRHAACFSAVRADEMAELSELLGLVERSLKAAFSYDIINYLMLMMVDHHVHFHVVPRYAAPRRFAGLDWVDNGWPAFPALADRQHADRSDIPSAIRQALQAAGRG